MLMLQKLIEEFPDHKFKAVSNERHIYALFIDDRKSPVIVDNSNTGEDHFKQLKKEVNDYLGTPIPKKKKGKKEKGDITESTEPNSIID